MCGVSSLSPPDLVTRSWAEAAEAGDLRISRTWGASDRVTRT